MRRANQRFSWAIAAATALASCGGDGTGLEADGGTVTAATSTAGSGGGDGSPGSGGAGGTDGGTEPNGTSDAANSDAASPDALAADAPDAVASDAIDTDAARDSAPPFDAPDCSAIADIGPTVTRTADPSPLPTMTGGPILDGTYVLTSNVVYAATTTPGPSRKSTMEIAGSRVRYVDNYDGGDDSYFLMSASTNGATKWSLVILCPLFVGGELLEFEYTATAMDLAILAAPGRIETWTKQP